MPVTRGFGIVGAGVIAAIHADAIALLSETGLPNVRLVAVTDVAAGAAAAFAAAHGCPAEPDLGALLARPDVEVVCVCVPSGLHAQIGVQAARAGKHLVVEKPIDVSLEAADRLIAAARAAGVALTVISQHRFDPGLIELKRQLDEQALGRLVLGEASTKWYRAQAYYDSAAWRGTYAMDGGFKIPVDAPFGPELDRMRRVADIAAELGTTIVRVFSFFIPAGQPPERYRGQVIDRMGALARMAEEHGLIRSHLVYLQVKDALAATGEVVPAGQGDGELRETLAALRDSGFAGFMSLEPHLAQAGRFGGFSGPEGFRQAAAALKFLLNEASITWR